MSKIWKLIVISTMLLAGWAHSQQSPNNAAVTVVDVIPSDPPEMGRETNQDSEPFLSVDPTNPERMVISAFTPDPRGALSTSAPVFLSLDGGQTWNTKSAVPISVMTADITHAFVDSGLLQAGALKVTATPNGPRPDLLELSAQDSALSQLMLIQETRESVDQPFLAAHTPSLASSVFIAENYLGGQADGTASVEISRDNGLHFNGPSILETRQVSMQDGPSVRLAFARDGKSYAAFFGWRKFEPVDRREGWVTSDVIVARDDSGAMGNVPFQDLKDDSDHLAGRIVAKGVRIHWSNKPTLGQERTGSTLSLAVDPNAGSSVYVAWADNMNANTEYTIHVKRSRDAGISWQEIKQIGNATCAALAVADNGTLGFLYQRLTGVGANATWETHLEQTIDDFATSKDFTLAKTPANLPLQFLPYLGDYNFLLAVNKQFRGVFSANNVPNTNNFPSGVKYLRRVDMTNHFLLDANGAHVAPSIDPFYFSVNVLENPSKQWTPSPSGQLAMQTVAQNQPSSAASNNQQQPIDPETDLKSRLDAADVIILGHVVTTRDAGQAFVSTGGNLAAVPEEKPRISEHDPDWKEAVIKVDRPVKGVKKDDKIIVRFPSSLDVLYREYQKFQEGQEGLFLLKKSRASGGALQSLSDGTLLYAPPTKKNVLSKTEIKRVLNLLSQ